MTIRRATAADLPAVQACAEAAYEIYVARMGRKPAPMVADFAALITTGRLHVLEADGEVAGFVVAYPRDDHLHIENVAVFPIHQGKRFGRALIDFAEAQAGQQGLGAIELYTNEKMTENLAYYPTLGYREIGRWEEDGFKRVFFRKKL